jgi:hypothetical protein
MHNVQLYLRRAALALINPQSRTALSDAQVRISMTLRAEARTGAAIRTSDSNLDTVLPGLRYLTTEHVSEEIEKYLASR